MILAQLVSCFGDRGWLGGSVVGAKMRTGCPQSWGLEQGGVVAFFEADEVLFHHLDAFREVEEGF